MACWVLGLGIAIAEPPKKAQEANTRGMQLYAKKDYAHAYADWGRALLALGRLTVAPEARALIFEPFTQLNPSPGRAASGLGVGLTLVARLVALHGGTIDVFSEGPGTGRLKPEKPLPASSAPKPWKMAGRPVPEGGKAVKTANPSGY